MIKVYKTNVIEGLKDLASRDFQAVAWFENDQGLSSSYADDVNAVFDDTGLDTALGSVDVLFKNRV